MITFLRQLRRSLFGSKTTRKYLLYALGEFVLIVAGILVALQINNWNQWRKDRVLEDYYLHQLKQELTYNLDMVEQGIERQVRQHRDASMLLAVIEGDTVINESEVLAYAIEYTGYGHRVDYINNIWNELNSTGNIALISDNELRKELADMQRGFDRTIYYNTQFNNFNREFRRLAGDIIKGSVRTIVAKNMGDSKTREKVDGLAAPTVISQKLHERKDLIPYLADITMVRRAGLGNYTDDKEKMNQILELIEKYIE